MNWYISAIKNYVNFEGRARRKEYWMFVLFNCIFAVVASVIDRLIGSELTFAGQTMGYGVVGILYSLAVFLPGLALTVRRLHDIGKSGLWVLIVLVPCVGGIWLLVYEVMAGTVGENQYGPDPKAVEVL